MTAFQAIHRLKKLALSADQSEKDALEYAISLLSEQTDGYHAIEMVWNIEKQKAGEGTHSRYLDMNEWFLKDMEELTGSYNGFTYQNEMNLGYKCLNYCFFLQGLKYVDFMTVSFHALTGEFLGVRVWKKSYKAFEPKTPREEKRALIFSEANQMLIDFEKKATKLGYLIQDN